MVTRALALRYIFFILRTELTDVNVLSHYSSWFDQFALNNLFPLSYVPKTEQLVLTKCKLVLGRNKGRCVHQNPLLLRLWTVFAKLHVQDDCSSASNVVRHRFASDSVCDAAITIEAEGHRFKLLSTYIFVSVDNEFRIFVIIFMSYDSNFAHTLLLTSSTGGVW